METRCIHGTHAAMQVFLSRVLSLTMMEKRLTTVKVSSLPSLPLPRSSSRFSSPLPSSPPQPFVPSPPPLLISLSRAVATSKDKSVIEKVQHQHVAAPKDVYRRHFSGTKRQHAQACGTTTTVRVGANLAFYHTKTDDEAGSDAQKWASHRDQPSRAEWFDRGARRRLQSGGDDPTSEALPPSRPPARPSATRP